MDTQQQQNTVSFSLPEEQVPSVFLRKPFYLLLEHFSKEPEKYTKTWKMDDKSVSEKLTLGQLSEEAVIARLKNLASYIDKFENVKVDFKKSDIPFSEFEEKWCQDTIHIKKIYKIQKNFKVDIGQIIEQVIGLTPVLKEFPSGDRARILYNLNKLCPKNINSKSEIFLESTIIENVNDDKIKRIYLYIKQVVIPDLFKNKEDNLEVLKEINFIHDAWKKYIENRKVKEGTEKADISKAISSGKSLWQLTEHHSYLLEEFMNSKWLIYERTDSGNKSNNNRGYSISCLEIFSIIDKVFLPAKVTSKYQNQQGILEDNKFLGLVGLDETSKYIFISLKKDDIKLPSISFFVLRIDMNSLQDQEILIGYHLYFSAYFNKCITKVVCAQRVDKKTMSWQVIHKTPPFEPKDLTENITNEDVPQVIRRYLANRALNRLSMPEKIISFLYGRDRTLEKWLNNKIEQAANDLKLQACVGNYSIYYFIGNTSHLDPKYAQLDEDLIYKNLREDLLDVKYDEDLIDYKAHYLHRRGLNAKVLHEGFVSRKGNTVELILEYRENKYAKTTKANYIFLSFCIPDFDKNIFPLEFAKSEYNMLPGIISGLNDEYSTPISCLAMVVKNSRSNKIDIINDDYKLNLDDFSKKKIVNFFIDNFDRNRISVSPSFKSLDVNISLPNLERFIYENGKIDITRENIKCYSKDVEEPIYTSHINIRNVNNMLLEADKFIGNWFKENFPSNKED